MILDFGCDIKDCDSPVEFVKGANYQSLGGAVSILFLRCLTGHYYMKYKEDVPELQFFALKINETELIQIDDNPELIQDELPFDEGYD